MKIDLYTKIVLTAIALGLFLNISVKTIPDAHASSSNIIERILYCIDGGTVDQVRRVVVFQHTVIVKLFFKFYRANIYDSKKYTCSTQPRKRWMGY